MKKYLLIWLFALHGMGTAFASPSDDEWVFGQYVVNDQVILVRFLGELPHSRVREKHPQFLEISWRYTGGLPDKTLLQKMTRVEDAIMAVDTTHQQSMLVAVSTGNGARLFKIYAKNAQQFVKRLVKELRGQPRYPIEIYAAKDPDVNWSELKQYVRK